MKTIIQTLAIILVIVLSACNETENFEAQTFEYAVLLDLSRSNSENNTDSNYRALFETLVEEFAVSGVQPSSNGVRVASVPVGNPLIPPIYWSELEAKNWLLMPREERLEEIASFKKKLQIDIARLFETPANHEVTNLYKSMTFTLNKMDHTAKVRKLIIYSDAMESGDIDMEAFIANPAKMNEENQYNKLKDSLLEKAPLLEAYRGTEIVFIVPSDSRASYEASRFWSRLLSEAGLIVDVRSEY